MSRSALALARWRSHTWFGCRRLRRGWLHLCMALRRAALRCASRRCSRRPSPQCLILRGPVQKVCKGQGLVFNGPFRRFRHLGRRGSTVYSLIVRGHIVLLKPFHQKLEGRLPLRSCRPANLSQQAVVSLVPSVAPVVARRARALEFLNHERRERRAWDDAFVTGIGRNTRRTRVLGRGAREE